MILGLVRYRIDL